MRVEDVMTREVRTVDPAMSLKDVARVVAALLLTPPEGRRGISCARLTSATCRSCGRAS